MKNALKMAFPKGGGGLINFSDPSHLRGCFINIYLMMDTY